MRLDHFLPALTKVRGQPARKPGAVRRLLKRIGPTWASSPVRRVSQASFFLLFLWLFFYVCWPYRAQPSPVWRGWVPVEVNTESGRIVVAPSDPSHRPREPLRGLLHVVDESAGEGSGYLGAFVVEPAGGEAGWVLIPERPMSGAALEELSLSAGPWTLSAVPPGAWPSHYADEYARSDKVPVELFLMIDPLVSLSTALAGKTWVWSLTAAAVILLVCVAIPRGFCGYICPLGTLIDLFDWAIAGRVKRFRSPSNGWWVHLKYYLLAGVLVAGLGGVLLSGFVAAIPVVTRGMLFVLGPVQSGLLRGWHQVPPMNAGQWFSIGLFLGVLCLGFLRPRFWCKYVCPSGAVFSLGNLFRVSERKVEDTCIHCNKCVQICPFDAIKPDFTTRVTDCTLCQTCGGVCPTHSIKFVERWNRISLKAENDPPTGEGVIGRRTFLASAIGVLVGIAGGVGARLGVKTWGAGLESGKGWRPVRPPGSVPEPQFLELCIRCGECFKVCPNDVLQPMGFQQGLEGLWTPRVVADWAGCEPSCNACGQACPTGAIRALPLEEKRRVKMGLAKVNQATCLPWAGEEACQLCVDECAAAGYDAIEFVRVHTARDEQGRPVEGTGFLAPEVRADKCVGCGLCQMRCYSINAKTKRLLRESAIVVEAAG